MHSDICETAHQGDAMRFWLLPIFISAGLLATGCGGGDKTLPAGGMSDAEAQRWIDGLGSQAGELSDAERERLWELTRASPETRVQVLSRFLANPEYAAKFNRRYEYLVQACVGLDPDVRSRVAKEVIETRLKASTRDRNQRIALLLLGTELRLVAEYPKLAVIGLDTLLERARQTDRPNEWQALQAGAGQWIAAYPSDDFPEAIRRLEQAATSNVDLDQVWRAESPNIAAKLIQGAFSDPADAPSLAILMSADKPHDAASTRGAGPANVADRLLDLIEEQPQVHLQTALLGYLRKAPGGLSAAQAKRALKMTEPDFSKPNAGWQMSGVSEVVANLAPDAVPAVIPDLAKWYGYNAPGARPRLGGGADYSARLRGLLREASEQADSQTAGAALQEYEKAIEKIQFPPVDPFYLLTRKLPREEAQVYVARQGTFKNSDIVAFVARGLAESEAALDSEQRIEQIRLLAHDVPAKFRLYSSQPLGETLAATCARVGDGRRTRAVQILIEALSASRSHESLDAVCMGLAALAPSLAVEDAATVVRAVTGVAARSDYNDAGRIVERLEKIIRARPTGEITPHTEIILASISRSSSGAEGPLTKLTTKLSAELPQEDTARLARQTVSQMLEISTKSNDGRLSSLSAALRALAERLPAADRRPTAALIAEQATKAAERFAESRADGQDRLALRLIEAIARLPNDIPHDSAERLMSASLGLIEATGSEDGFRSPVEVALPAVANCISVQAAPKMRDRLRRIAGDHQSEFATRIRVVDACLPLKTSEQEMDALAAALPQGSKFSVSMNLGQLIVAAPLLADRFSDAQLLVLLNGVAELYAKDPYHALVGGDLIATLASAMSKDAALPTVQAIARAMAQMRNPDVRNLMSQGLQVACDRLSIEDLPALLDVLLAQPEFQPADRSATGRRTIRAEVVFRNRLEKFVVDHRDRTMAVLNSPQYTPRLQKLQPVLPSQVLAELKIEPPRRGDTAPIPNSFDQSVAELLKRQPKDVPIERAVSLLKHPECVGRIRQALLARLSERMAEQYEDNVWLFVAQANKAGISAETLKRPPQRE